MCSICTVPHTGVEWCPTAISIKIDKSKQTLLGIFILLKYFCQGFDLEVSEDAVRPFQNIVCKKQKTF